MNENIINSPTDSQIIIDYDRLEECFVDALREVVKEENEKKAIEEDKKASQKAINSESDLVEFSSSTDAKLYTVQSVAEPTTSAQQRTAYILDIRNILLIILLFYFSFSIYSKLKTSLINFMKNRG